MSEDRPGEADPSTRLSLGEVNALVAAYFDEAGLAHSAFTLRQECRLAHIKFDGGLSLADVPVPQGQLVRILMKGLLYLEAEVKWRGDVSAEEYPRLLGHSLPTAAPFKPLPMMPPSALSPTLASPDDSRPQSPHASRARSSIKTPGASPGLNGARYAENIMELDTPVASTSRVPLDAPALVNGHIANGEHASSPEDANRPASTFAYKRKDRNSAELSEGMDVDSKPLEKHAVDEMVSRDVKRPRIDESARVTIDDAVVPSDRLGTTSSTSRPGTPVDNLMDSRPSSHMAIAADPILQPPTGINLNVAVKEWAVPEPRPNLATKSQEEMRKSTISTAPSSVLAMGPLATSNGRAAGGSTVAVSVKTVTLSASPATPPVAGSARLVPNAPSASSSKTALPTGTPALSQRRSVSPNVMRRVRSRSPGTYTDASNSEKESVNVDSDSKESRQRKPHMRGSRVSTQGSLLEEKLAGPNPDTIIPETAVVRFSGAPRKYCSSPCAFNNNLLATGSNDSQLRIYEVPTIGGGSIIAEHANGKHAAGAKKIEIPCAAWNADGTLLATGSEDGVVRCWTIAGELTGVLTMHQGSVWCLKWHIDGTRLLTGSHDYSVILWDAGTTHMKQNWTTHTDRVMCVDWIDHSYWCSCSRDGQVHIMSTGRTAPVARLRGHADDVNFIRVDPTQSLLASCSSDQTVRVWSLVGLAGPRLGNTAPEEDDINAPELERKGGSITLRGHEGEVHQLAWQPGAGVNEGPRLLASVSSDHTGRVWDVDQGTCLFLLKRHIHEVYSLCFRPMTGDILALGSNDGRVSFWSMQDGHEIAEYTHSPDTAGGDDRRVYEVLWHPKRNQVAVTGTGTAVLLLDAVPAFPA